MLLVSPALLNWAAAKSHVLACPQVKAERAVGGFSRLMQHFAAFFVLLAPQASGHGKIVSMLVCLYLGIVLLVYFWAALLVAFTAAVSEDRVVPHSQEIIRQALELAPIQPMCLRYKVEHQQFAVIAKL